MDWDLVISQAVLDKILILDDSRGESLIEWFGFCQLSFREITSLLMGTSQLRLHYYLHMAWASDVGAVVVGIHQALALNS